MKHEKELSILYQKEGRATQFSSKAARDQWLQKEIVDLEQVLSSNTAQVRIHLITQIIQNYGHDTVFS
jgi:structural maintenance of chromosome 3 (chondroitin sulfate proteoglycan 6)